MSTDRLSSTGRNPALRPDAVRRLLERYFAEDKPSLSALAEEFAVANGKGELRTLSLATVRKYLKAAGLSLPRGRAADLPREPQNVQMLMNRIPTEILLGEGRTKLLLRQLSRGEGVVALAKAFGVSKDRVCTLRDRAATMASKPDCPSEAEIQVAESLAQAANIPLVLVDLPFVQLVDSSKSSAG